ncbi:MAG: hypothetical protein J0I32_05755 [Sphingobacteriales bacterium]|nr:hypothetical protein [Sphingobacteriales bacterium]OJW03926.1 MAG: hypothetical protein BGO52_17405 [Sphingobacteriales bacterium 44-61]
MNENLIQLYTSKWDNYFTMVNPILKDDNIEVKPANPLLLYIADEEAYKQADIRLMIFGQETNSWYEERDVTIAGVQNLYDGFFNDGECWNYGGQFWNGVGRFLTSLHQKYPTKKIQLLWNNIVKVGKQGDKGFPPDYIYEIERKHFNVIPDELTILKPDIVLFFTGPNYDSVLADNFGTLEYNSVEPFSQRELSRLKLLDIPFVFRTYHPNYLWRNDIDWYFDTILNNITIA